MVSQYLKVGCAVGLFLYLGNLDEDNRIQEKKTFVGKERNIRNFLKINMFCKSRGLCFRHKVGANGARLDLVGAPQEDGVEKNTLAGYCTGEVAEIKTRKNRNNTTWFIL